MAIDRGSNYEHRVKEKKKESSHSKKGNSIYCAYIEKKQMNCQKLTRDMRYMDKKYNLENKSICKQKAGKKKQEKIKKQNEETFLYNPNV